MSEKRSNANAVLCSHRVATGLISTIKTMTSEMAHGDERRESLGLTIVIGMWGWGFLVSPVIAGLLAEPIRQYEWEDRDSFVFDVLR